MQTLFGGSSSSSGPSGITGFGSLPSAIRNAYTGLATTASNTLNPGSSGGGAGTPASNLFTLPSLGTGATNALSQLQNQDFAVTPQSIQSDVNEQMNPYNNSVIGQIEQAQNGQESQLSQYLTQAGQFGSNRGMVGASDISQQAANQIGSFLDNQYNTSLQNALTTIPQAGITSASGAVNAGLLQQQQGLQNQLAPVSALQALAQLTGVQPSNTNVSQQSSSSSSGGIF
jgi:hypothetical protein